MAQKELKTTTKDVNTLPEFKAGDTVRVHYKIIEGDKTRIQPYEGIVIARKGTGMSKSFTVRRIGADNIAIERIFPLFSPNIDKLELIKTGDVRRAKLYYLRDKKGRSAMRIKEGKAMETTTNPLNEVTEEPELQEEEMIENTNSVEETSKE